jgi:hypothetical protein
MIDRAAPFAHRAGLRTAALLALLLAAARCTGEAQPPSMTPPPIAEPPPRPGRADARPTEGEPPTTPPDAAPSPDPTPTPTPTPTPPPAGPDAAPPADGPSSPDPGPPPADAGPPPNAGMDPFGVRKIHPTRNGGREWYMPANATQSDGEWGGGNSVTATGEPGVFRVNGSPRIPVASPAGKAWWRNVEMTGYYRYRSTLPAADLTPGFQMYARGERHTANMVNGASVNGGRQPPAGTPTWPGYPYSGMINGHCLGSSYKGYMDINGSMDFKKEVSHTAGYTGARDSKKPFGGTVPTNQWVGFKVVIRNYDNNRAVHMESWLDPKGDGTWQKINDVRDNGGWAGGANPDGCGGAPFNYKDDQIINWAGPHVNWRFDFVSVDVKWFSAREVDPLD